MIDSDRSSMPLGLKFKFARRGECDAELQELIAHIASVAEGIAVGEPLVPDAFNHAPAQAMPSTGSQRFGRPSRGA